ncbi:MAG: magnesium transporter MgtE N-terminal domain-containing protein [Planctomycetota bacterium]|jgi:flagellar motility protein MotE (MotC chaperone)
MIKIKLNIKKFIPYIIFFIIFFSISSVVMIVLKKEIEKKMSQYYSAKLLAINEENFEKEKSEKAEEGQKKIKNAARILREFSPEEIRKYQQELRQRLDMYEKKIALLDKNEKEIEAFKTDIENRKNEIASLRKELEEELEFISRERIDLDNDLVLFDEGERKNLRRLSDIYASMEALKAAEVLSKLKHDTGAKVLTGMPSKKSAKILAEIDPSGAAIICEQIKKMQIVGSALDESLKERNIKKLAAIYQKMDTGKAVTIIQELENETAISILSRMDEKKLAKILEFVETDEASKLTEEIRKIMKKEIQKNDEKMEGA